MDANPATRVLWPHRWTHIGGRYPHPLLQPPPHPLPLCRIKELPAEYNLRIHTNTLPHFLTQEVKILHSRHPHPCLRPYPHTQSYPAACAAAFAVLHLAPVTLHIVSHWAATGRCSPPAAGPPEAPGRKVPPGIRDRQTRSVIAASANRWGTLRHATMGCVVGQLRRRWVH